MRIRTAIFLILVLAVAVWAGRNLLVPWQLWGHSSSIDYARLLELDHQIREGASYPRWCSNFYYGYGSPMFNFYAPAGYWIGQISIFLGANILYGVKIPYFLAFLVGGTGMFLFVRELWGSVAGAASAVCYVLAPYFLLDVYVRAALGEVLCLAWIPAAMFFLVRALRGSPRSGVIAAFFIAAIIFSHNITALIFFPAVLLFLVLQWRSTSIRSAFPWTLTMVALALGLAAFFWLPVLVEKHFVVGEEVLTTGDYYYGDHFIGFRQLLEPRWGWGTSQPGDFISLQLGILHWILIAAAFVTFILRQRLRGPTSTWLWIIFGGSIFFTLPWSKFLWDFIPLVHFLQFPWRLLLFAAFASSALAGAVFSTLQGRKARWQTIALASLLTATLLAYGRYTQAKFLVADVTTREPRALERQELDASRQDPELIPLEEFMTIDTMRHIGMRASILDDYLPIWVAQKPVSLPDEDYLVVEGEVEVETVGSGTVERTYRLRSAGRGYVEFNTFWFPGWVGLLDGVETEIFPRRPTGCIGVDVPPGEHTFEIKFKNTPVRNVGVVISLVSLACAGVLLVRPQVFAQLRKSQDTS